MAEVPSNTPQVRMQVPVSCEGLETVIRIVFGMLPSLGRRPDISWLLPCRISAQTSVNLSHPGPILIKTQKLYRSIFT
jgi:hypothetical protein